MKKTLLLIPAAALLLVGCGEKEIEEDTNTNPTVSQVSEAAVASLSNMYKSAVKGLSLSLNVSGANCHYVNSYTGNMYTKTEDVEVKNAGFKLKLDVRNLDKSIKDWEAAIVVEDLQATETVIVNSNDRTVLSQSKTFSDIDFAVYLRNGNLYANLSDPELKTTAKDVIDIMYGVNSEEGAQYKAMVDQYAKNLYLNDAIDVIADLFTSVTTKPKEEYYPEPEPEPVKSLKAVSGISDLILFPSEIPAEDLLDIKEELPMILTQIMSPNSPLKDAFNFVLKDNLFKKIEVNFSSADLPAETFDGDDVNFTASLTANFGDAGLLTSIDTNEVFDVTIEDNYADFMVTGGVAHSSTDITHVTGSIGAKIGISYPTSSISMPDFSGYELFVFPEF